MLVYDNVINQRLMKVFKKILFIYFEREGREGERGREISM